MINYLFTLSIPILLLTGCINNQHLATFTEKNNTLSIINFDIKDIEQYNYKQLSKNSTLKVSNRKNSLCKDIKILEINASKNLFNLSALEDIKKSYNNKCNTQQIQNINFSKCTKKIDNKAHSKYFITQSLKENSKYKRKTTISMDKECFYQIKASIKQNQQ